MHFQRARKGVRIWRDIKGKEIDIGRGFQFFLGFVSSGKIKGCLFSFFLSGLCKKKKG